MMPRTPTPQFAIILALALCCCALIACAQGEIDSNPDAGADPTVDASTDATDPDVSPPDADPQTPDPLTPTLATSAGGAILETANHRVRLLVGPRGGARSFQTNNHRISLGAGTAQHVQTR